MLSDNLPEYAGPHKKPGVTLRTGEFCRQPSNVAYVHKSKSVCVCTEDGVWVCVCVCVCVFCPLPRPPQPEAEFQTGKQRGRLSLGGVGVLLGPWHKSRDPEKDKIQSRTEKNRLCACLRACLCWCVCVCVCVCVCARRPTGR